VTKRADRKPTASPDLRERAEAEWQVLHKGVAGRRPDDIARLLHELEVHQIELEVQNEELLRSQRELEESRRKFSDLYDFAPVGYLTIDQDTRITQANLTISTMLVVERTHLVGRRFIQFVQRQSMDQLYRAQRHGASTWNGELMLRPAKGVGFPALVEMRRERDSAGDDDGTGVLSWRCVVTDITTRKAAEEALRQTEALQASEERYRGLAEQVVDGIIVTNAEGKPLDANRAACDMFGYTLDEMKTLRVEDGIAAEELPKVPEAIQRASKEVLRTEWRLKRKDGSLFIAEILGRQLPDGRLQAVIRDITERKRLEEERADEARRKDEFMAFLGHELRNPLAAIHTAIQVLSGETTPALRGRMEDIIARQTALMRHLVDDLLEHERIARGRIELKPSRLDLAGCLTRAAAVMQSTVASRKQELRVRLPFEPVLFMADGPRLDQIIGNLLTNASKYTGRGGSIELSAAREGRDVVVRCKDNGQGVPGEYQKKIFEPFASGPKTTLGYGEASVGLGLALVKQLAELHGGTISVDSAGVGLGSEFTVRLPFVAPADQPVGDEPVPARVARLARSVVIVEDNPSVGATLKAALEQAGHSVHLFEDGPTALAVVSDLKPDALVIDIGLPGMDGYELAAKLKQQKITKDTLLIAVSGFKQRKQVLADVFDRYFNKPIDVPELLALLDEPTTT
jgi:two-component system CheB/CheR fusion protein